MTSEIDDIYDGIVQLLSHGPALTVDIAENLRKDTVQTSAILDYYVGKGEIGKTQRRYGTSNIYFLPQDRDIAIAKLYGTLDGNEKALVNKIKTTGVVRSSDLAPAERIISQSLGDFIKRVSARDSDTGEKVDYIYYYTLSLDEVKRSINVLPAAKTSVQVRQHTAGHGEGIPKQVRKPSARSGELTPEVKNMLFANGFSGVTRIGSDVYYCDYGQNRLKVVVVLSNKPTLKKKDLIKVAGYASAYKTVAFVLTHASKLPDSKEYGNSINFVRLS